MLRLIFVGVQRTDTVLDDAWEPMASRRKTVKPKMAPYVRR